MTPDRIQREIVIDAPVERVWSVLTEAEHIGTWFAEHAAEIELRPGGRLTLQWSEHQASRARVEVVEPPHRFAYRWAAHFAAGEEPAEGNSTLVEFTLTEDRGRTRLRVVETGFAGLATDADERRRNVEDNTDGWKTVLGRLEAHVARVTA